MKQDAKIGNVFPTMKSQGAAKNEANNAAQTAPAAEAAPAKVEIDFSKAEVEPLFEDMVENHRTMRTLF